MEQYMNDKAKKPTTVIDQDLVINSEDRTPYNVPGQVTQLPVSQADRLVEMAITQGADPERLDRLLDLKERYDKEEARKAFTAALAGFKGEDVTINKDKGVGYKDKQGNWVGYQHASLGNVVSTAVPHMSRHGLSHRWDIVQENGSITVTCILTHEGGHSESVKLTAPPDDSGKKNQIQQVASTITYLERYTFLSITGLAVEDQADDDGQAAAQVAEVVEYINTDQINALHAKHVDNDMDMEIFLRWLATSSIKAGRLEDIPANMFKTVMSKVDAGIAAKAKASQDLA
jgi:hypothetical protein